MLLINAMLYSNLELLLKKSKDASANMVDYRLLIFLFLLCNQQKQYVQIEVFVCQRIFDQLASHGFVEVSACGGL